MREIFEAMVDWYMDSSAEPLFMLVQGLVLGAVIVGCIWLMSKGLRIEGEDKDEQSDV